MGFETKKFGLGVSKNTTSQGVGKGNFSGLSSSILFSEST